jgi:cytochrome c oxidase subunit IV
MNSILEFFEPTNGFMAWLGNFALVLIISYLVVWLLAFILGRIGWPTSEDNQLKVYFAWMIPLILHMLLAGVIMVYSAMHFKELDFSLGYSLFFLLPLFFNFKFTHTLHRKIKDRVNRLEKRIKE